MLANEAAGQDDFSKVGNSFICVQCDYQLENALLSFRLLDSSNFSIEKSDWKKSRDILIILLKKNSGN